MITRDDLGVWIIEALKYYGGKATIVEVCKYVWNNYENEIRNSGDMLYKWQYEIRWSANQLRISNVLKSSEITQKGYWELVD